MVYSTKLLRITKFEYLAHPRLNDLAPRRFSMNNAFSINKEVLEHKYHRTRFFTSRFGCSTFGAERLLFASRFSSPGHPQRAALITLELVGTGGQYCAVVDIPFRAIFGRSMFERAHDDNLGYLHVPTSSPAAKYMYDTQQTCSV